MSEKRFIERLPDPRSFEEMIDRIAHGDEIYAAKHATRPPGQYGDRHFLSEHKLCGQCNEPETRLDARFCCWCGKAFEVVIISGLPREETILISK